MLLNTGAGGADSPGDPGGVINFYAELARRLLI